MKQTSPSGKGIEETTWEPELTMRAQYPQLFNLGMNFEDEIILRGREY